MRWFGKHWGAPVCDTASCIAIPAGEECARCKEKFDSSSQGFAIPHYVGDDPFDEKPHFEESYYHLNCLLRSVGVKQ